MDNLYAYPDEAVAQIRKQKLWCNDAKYFKKVKISPSATIKMLSHGQQGVEKGISKAGKPIEVMGLLLGRPDITDQQSLVISDALPLPIEGFETRVVADDENVINYMIELGESMELTRKEKFCGWYHTHPFDLDGTSHCFLSNTDITTQLQWQRMEDPHGNPWLAIVIDPLLSLAKNKPEIMAFRVYPPEYSSPNQNETPDGKIMKDDRLRVEKWGACWNRYYQLPIEYFMSNLAQDSLQKLSNKFLWEKPFLSSSSSSSSSSSEAIQEELSNLSNITNKISKMRFSSMRGRSSGGGGPFSSTGIGGAYEEEIAPIESSSDYPSSIASGGGIVGGQERDIKGLKIANQIGNDIAMNHLCTICSLLVKKNVFCHGTTTNSSSTTSQGDNNTSITGKTTAGGGSGNDKMEVST